MEIYAVSKGEGKNLYVKNTKFFSSEEKAKNYLNSLTYTATFIVFKDYDPITNELTRVFKMYAGKKVTEEEKRSKLLMNERENKFYNRHREIKWEEGFRNEYVITKINIEEGE